MFGTSQLPNDMLNTTRAKLKMLNTILIFDLQKNNKIKVIYFGEIKATTIIMLQIKSNGINTSIILLIL